MHERTERLAGSLVTLDRELEREFEARLADSSRLAFRVAFSVLRQREDAEDVAQEAFAKAYRSFNRLRDRERFRAWLVRTTWRTALDRQRANRRRLAREIPADIDERERAGTTEACAATGDALEAIERAGRLWAAIEALPEKLRLVIVLAAIEGHDLKEVASLLGVPEGTVKSRLFLGRRRLREQLSWMFANTKG